MLIPRYLVLAIMATPALARANPCSEAFNRASVEGQGGQLVEARRALISCTAEACPATMRPICVSDLAKLEPRIPTVVVAVSREDGTDVPDAQVTIDDKPAALDGKAIELDPGPHRLRAEREGLSAQQAIVAREGEKDRIVKLVLSQTTAAGTERHRPVPWSVWVTTGAVLVAGALWAGFGISGLVQKSALDACKGSCAQSAVSSTMTAFNVADVSALVTVVAVTVDVVLFVTRPVVVAPVVTANGAGLYARIVF